MKEYRKSQTKEKNLLCRLAEIVAPQASEFCWGFIINLRSLIIYQNYKQIGNCETSSQS